MLFQVLEGWLFLGNVQELSSRLTNAYMAAVSASCTQTVRSVLLTQPALAQRALSGTSVQDLTRDVPSDIFRTCLARVSLILSLCPQSCIDVMKVPVVTNKPKWRGDIKHFSLAFPIYSAWHSG